MPGQYEGLIKSPSPCYGICPAKNLGLPPQSLPQRSAFNTLNHLIILEMTAHLSSSGAVSNHFKYRFTKSKTVIRILPKAMVARPVKIKSILLLLRPLKYPRLYCLCI
jgi:hypothetical protein